jgi:hypothetical protein
LIRYRRADHIAWRRVGEETILVHLDRKRMLALNAAGGLVWEALAEPRDIVEIARVLLGPPDEAGLRRVEAFLQELGREGVLGGDPPAGAPPPGAAPDSTPGAPAIAWREAITPFAAGTCGLHPGQGGPCEGYATTS